VSHLGWLRGVPITSSNLKPSKNKLEANLDQYRTGCGAYLSELEFSLIRIICQRADKAMRVAARIALADVPEHLKCNFFPTLTAGDSLSPTATQVGSGEAYRISIPISFVAKLVAIAPKRVNTPKDESDYLVSSTIVAVLAAYGHEMTHIFAGHLGTQSSLGQETHADYIGGGLLWAWLHDKNIAMHCDIADGKQTVMYAYGVLHLISAFDDTDNNTSLYLPRCLRLVIFCGGAAFHADKRAGESQGDLVEQAFESMPSCPEASFDSLEIRKQFGAIKTQLEQREMVGKLKQAFKIIEKEKKSWYKSSQHLRPIKKDLYRALKRNEDL